MELFRERNGDSAAFRANLNEFWSGVGGKKEFASKANLDWPETYLSILGLTQPIHFAKFIEKVEECGPDGLRDRFISISAYGIREMFDDVQYQRPDLGADWPLIMLKAIWELHHGDPKKYTLSIEAQEWREQLLEMTNAEDDEAKEKFAMKVLAEEQITKKDIPVPRGTSKDMDIATKLAGCLHVLEYSLSRLVDHNSVEITGIPAEISKETLDSAINLVSVCRMQVTRGTTANV